MQRRLSDALQLQVEVDAVRNQLLGSGYPHVLWDMSDLAKCHRDLGVLHIAEACRLQGDSVRPRERVLRPSHHDTLWAQNDLGGAPERVGGPEADIRPISPNDQTLRMESSRDRKVGAKERGRLKTVGRECFRFGSDTRRVPWSS
jgi:hypothetical protein